VIHSKTQGQTQTKKNQTALTDVVKQKREAQSTHASNTVDTVGNALAAWVEELEEKANVTPSTQMQMQLSKAQKALNFYRARNDREFSQTDRRLLLEQQVNALDFVYTKQLEAGAPDNKTAELKQKIDQTKKELADLDKK
jgi:hypothetical protein